MRPRTCVVGSKGQHGTCVAGLQSECGLDASAIANSIDISLQLAGLAVVGVIGVRLGRGRGQASTLQLDPALNLGPGLATAALITFSYFLFQAISAAWLPFSNGTGPIPPGSSEWNLLNLAECAAKLAATAMIVLSFAVSGTTTAGSKTPAQTSGAWVVLIAFLASLPICYSQAAVGDWIWKFVHAGARAPDHQVLLGFTQNEWGVWGRLMLVFVAVVIAPVTEELYFRGLLLGGFMQLTRMPWLSVALSAVAFGAAHAVQPQVVAPIVTLGLILGYVRLRMNSLTLCILIHALFNARTMGLLWLDPNQIQ